MAGVIFNNAYGFPKSITKLVPVAVLKEMLLGIKTMEPEARPGLARDEIGGREQRHLQA